MYPRRVVSLYVAFLSGPIKKSKEEEEEEEEKGFKKTAFNNNGQKRWKRSALSHLITEHSYRPVAFTYRISYIIRIWSFSKGFL